MHTRKTIKHEVESKTRVVQVRLLTFRTKAEKAHATAPSGNIKQIRTIERQTDETEARLSKLNVAEELTRKQLNDGTKDAWSALDDSLQDDIALFEGEH